MKITWIWYFIEIGSILVISKGYIEMKDKHS